MGKKSTWNLFLGGKFFEGSDNVIFVFEQKDKCSEFFKDGVFRWLLQIAR